MRIQRSSGATRQVFILKNVVIKIPSFVEWRLFLHGLLANIQESKFSDRCDRDDLCPVVNTSRFGFMLVMKKAKVFSDDINWDIFKTIIENKYTNDEMREFMCSDLKPSNFGILDGRLVKIDYGN